MTSQQAPAPFVGKGIVKQVNSADTIIIRGTPKGGPPDELTFGLAGITAPKLARRPNNNGEGATKDEPYAWEAREYLRKRLIGKRVCFSYEKTKGQEQLSKSQKVYGIVYDGSDTNAENVTEALVSQGLVDVRRNRPNEYIQKLCDLEDVAKAAGIGKHAPDASEHVRDIKWTIDDPQHFKDNLGVVSSLDAVVEHVVDGSTIRVCMFYKESPAPLPYYYYAKVMLSGIRCCGFTGDDQTPEPYALEAKFFTESRLLHRDVNVVLDSVQNKNFFGTILHPNGNIAALLAREGFAKVVDWSLNSVRTEKASEIREALKEAKSKKLRTWKDYAPSGKEMTEDEKHFKADVIEIVNADALIVKLPRDNSKKKIFLSSVRPPRMPENSVDSGKTRIRALYDIPYMLEAREYLRKRFIHKTCNFTVDYIQPPNAGFPEKICCTVHWNTNNVAEGLISRGLATCVKYRADDDQRSSCYDDLIAAENKANKSGKGLHSTKDATTHRIVDLSGDLKSSKQYFSLLQRAGKLQAVVEFVPSGSRLRLYLPRQNYVITFLLAGISCQKPSRETPNGLQPGDLYGDEALKYVKEMILQRDVTIEIESMDKAGNYIGYLWMTDLNINILMVKQGFADIHPSASRSLYHEGLKEALKEAQQCQRNIWENYKPVEPEPETEEKSERVIAYKEITITETKEDLTDLMFYAQHIDEGPKLLELMEEIRQDFETTPPVVGSYTPKKGDLCAAKYSDDGLWYRGKVVKVQGQQILILFIDFGNKEYTTSKQLASLPAKYQSLPAGAHEYGLAFIKLPTDPDSAQDARNSFSDEAAESPSLSINVEYKSSSSYVTLVKSEGKEDIGKGLVEKGLVLVEKTKGKKFQKIISDYVAAQEVAKKNRANLWQYGDITEDDAKEFG